MVEHRTKIGYMDGIDFNCELGANPSGNTVYPSIDTLRDGLPCVNKGGCGIAEVEVRFIRWIEEPDY